MSKTLSCCSTWSEAASVFVLAWFTKTWSPIPLVLTSSQFFSLGLDLVVLSVPRLFDYMKLVLISAILSFQIEFVDIPRSCAELGLVCQS